MIEGFQWGGQLQNTTDVENYPGYPEGIMGPEMMNEFRAQAERFGTRFITDDATELKLTDGGIHEVYVGDDEHRAKTVILAMGAEPKRLGIPGEMELGGRGVSTCGVCDGAFFKGEDVAVIGGGDSAMEDSIFVSKFADKLTIVHRRDEFRASQIMEDRARAKDNIEFLTPYVPEEFVAGDDGKIDSVRLEHAETGEEKELEVGGAFVAIGHTPALRAGRGPGRPRRRTATSRSRSPRPGPSSPASSRSATSSTTPTARRSPPPAPAARAPSTPSGTCATCRAPRPRRTGRKQPGEIAAGGRGRLLAPQPATGNCPRNAAAASVAFRAVRAVGARSAG